MKPNLFITGATGFVGRYLLRTVDPEKYQRIVCLSRRSLSENHSKIEWLQGELQDPGSYSAALEGVSVVLHLAAATGKASRAEFQRINVDGTRSLIEACRSQRVPSMLYVSTIAARFPDQQYYYYAQSKAAAEKMVASSGLRYTIVRPTIVFGKYSPVLRGLRGLADAPVIPVFGTGKAAVQPISVEDLVSAFLKILETDRFRGEILELGGPEVLTMEALLLRIRRASKGGGAKVVHLPVKALRTCLAAIEPYLLGAMPLTAGQLASFINDGAAGRNPSPALHTSLTPLDETLKVAL
jgi:NADH dehydrogenase